MDSSKINLGHITQIPENEFKEHFREWMERDDVARCLQAKLRRDLILNFNKTTLGKNLFAQACATNRLNLSPLVLALNTLVAEFLYAQNCHFTLSVFCTEVPYRNTLPDFEVARHFRFSEQELIEIFDALSTNWSQNDKDEICTLYTQEQGVPLLFLVLKCLLYKQVTPESDEPQEKTQRKSEKICEEKQQFRNLNKVLIVFLKKLKEMTANMALMQAQKTEPQTHRKSMNMRKLDNLHRSMHKLSENIRLMSVKRKSKNLTTLVTAFKAMGKQFKRCADQANTQKAVDNKESEAAPVEKSYDKWVEEMKTTPNGKKFLAKIEQSLHKALILERERLEGEFETRLQLQKNILKVKYKQKLNEELGKVTAREKADATARMNETLEQKLKEMLGDSSSDKCKCKAPPSADTISHKETQTFHTDASETKERQQSHTKSSDDKPSEDAHRHVDDIVFDAKQRVAQLEHESTQLDRNIRDYLEKKKSEKSLVNKIPSSILNTYEYQRSVLEKRCAAFRPSYASNTRAIESNKAAIIDNVLPQTSKVVLKVNGNIEEPVDLSDIHNAFRAAHQQMFAKKKANLMKDSSSNAGNKQDPVSMETIEKSSVLSSDTFLGATKVTVFRAPTSTFEIKKLSSENTASDSSIVESSSSDTEENCSCTCSPNKVGKDKREVPDEAVPFESNAQQKNSAKCEKEKSLLKNVKKNNGDGDAKQLIQGYKKNKGGTTPARSAPAKKREIKVPGDHRARTPKAR